MPSRSWHIYHTYRYTGNTNTSTSQYSNFSGTKLTKDSTPVTTIYDRYVYMPKTTNYKQQTTKKIGRFQHSPPTSHNHLYHLFIIICFTYGLLVWVVLPKTKKRIWLSLIMFYWCIKCLCVHFIRFIVVYFVYFVCIFQWR